MKFNEALGIDVSKKTIDANLHLDGSHRVFDNSIKGFKALLSWAKKESGLEPDQLLICFEHTGLYSFPLAAFLDKQQICFSMVAGLEIKRSLGIVRGKNDKVDAKRISEYAYLRREQMTPFVLPSKNILKLQKLLSLRDKLVVQRAGFMATVGESKAMLIQKDFEPFLSIQKKMIDYLNKQITTIEQEIMQTIDGDQTMKELYELVVSVKGVGFIIGVNFLVTTNCFMSFKDSRKYACYAGIAPFKKQSGTSVNTKSRVSHYANKNMKALLNMGARSAIQFDQELKTYYRKRVESGKSKMSTLNIVKNKIVHRVFAVVRRGTPYAPLYKHAS